MWNPVNLDVRIPADMDTSYLHLRIGNLIVMAVMFYGEEGNTVGGFVILSGESVNEYMFMLSCQSSPIPFLTSLPADKHWVVEKRGYRFIIHCNGKLVVNKTATSDTCTENENDWNTIWGREVNKIQIVGSDLSTASYYIGWCFGSELQM